MRVYRCFAPGNWKSGDLVSLDKEEARHLGAVRRLDAGQPVLLLNGEGTEFHCEAIEAGRDRVTLRVSGINRSYPRPPSRAIAWGLTKSPAFDDIFHRAIELGMTDFIPLQGDRSEVRWDGSRWEKKETRFARLSIEALKQCERLWLPRLHPPADLKGALGLTENASWRPILLHERADAIPLHRMADEASGNFLLLIGPEGG
ncbi:MAG: 16S rRNA (uracil(1498)-N(3))-methyltransferase, partial [Candidatus Sumerlaeia bacterium]|nr:16S rRNA (uracil(1498)-N(3))-methyltransferase [Candidatus Sumerlaeia bacterium]